MNEFMCEKETKVLDDEFKGFFTLSTLFFVCAAGFPP